MHRVSLHYHTT